MAARTGARKSRRRWRRAWPGELRCYDTAAMYSGGASERRLGELGRNEDVILATKFPSGFRATAESMPRDLDASIRLGRVDLY